MTTTANRLDPSADGESFNCGVRFTRAQLHAIDAEVRRLTALVGVQMDRSKAVRSIVQRWIDQSGAPVADVAPVVTPTPTPAPTPKAPRPAKGKPTARREGGVAGAAARWGDTAPPADVRRVMGELSALVATGTSARSIARDSGASTGTLARAFKAHASGAVPSMSEGTFKVLRAWLDARA